MDKPPPAKLFGDLHPVWEDRGVIAGRVSCRRARPSDVTYTRVRGHHVAAVATASSAESEISNSATALPNFETPARSSATPFSKPESKMRNCYRIPGNLRRCPSDALAATGNAKPRPMPGQTRADQGKGGPTTNSSRDDSRCRTSKGSRLAASGRAPSIGHCEIKAVEPIRCGDPDRPARPLRPDTRFNRQRRYGGNGVGCCNACSGDPRPECTRRYRRSRSVLAHAPIRCHEHKTSRPSCRPRCNGVIG